MKIYDFLEKYLPDFQAKELDFTINVIGFPLRIRVESAEFYEKYFPEALANYTDLICEKQRKMCCFEYSKVDLSDPKDKKRGSRISNAPQPNPEEL